MPAKIT